MTMLPDGLITIAQVDKTKQSLDEYEKIALERHKVVVVSLKTYQCRIRCAKQS